MIPNGRRLATCCQRFTDDQTAQADSIKRQGRREIRDIPEAITTTNLNRHRRWNWYSGRPSSLLVRLLHPGRKRNPERDVKRDHRIDVRPDIGHKAAQEDDDFELVDGHKISYMTVAEYPVSE
ncbi:hypothetical protein MMC22_007213 [Lobaria immixta]|nr:hypothetical protein [Lobaria immixta]